MGRSVKLRCLASCMLASATILTTATTNAAAAWGHSLPLTQINKPSEITNLSAPETQRFLTQHDARLKEHQIDPLQAVVSVDFPNSIQSVRDATLWTLTTVGYSLVEQGPRTAPELQTLLHAPLPVMQRSLHQVHVSEILRALAGIGHVVVVDHINRLITFDPRPLYAQLPSQIVPNSVPADQSLLGSTDSILIVPAQLPHQRVRRIKTPSLREQLGKIESTAATARPDTLASQDNVTLLGRSSFSETYGQYTELQGMVVSFSETSQRLQRSDDEYIKSLAETFTPATDLVSIIGCANTVGTNKNNRTLAEARARAIRNRLINLGVDRDLILDEACWSTDPENLPNHGAIVALKRSKGGE